MTKSFYEYLADADVEHELKVVVADSGYQRDTIRHLAQRTELAASKYDLRGKVEFRQLPMGDMSFPGFFGVTYEANIILGVIPESGMSSIRDEIAEKCRVSSKDVIVYDPKDPDSKKGATEPTALLDSEPGEHENDNPTPDAAELVAQPRISTLLASLEQDRKSRAAADSRVSRDFTTTHIGLKSLLGESHRKGYYRVTSSPSMKLEVHEHFASKPDLPLVMNRQDLVRLVSEAQDSFKDNDIDDTNAKIDDYDIYVSDKINTALTEFKEFFRGSNKVVSYYSDDGKAYLNLKAFDVDGNYPIEDMIRELRRVNVVKNHVLIELSGDRLIFTPNPSMLKKD